MIARRHPYAPGFTSARPVGPREPDIGFLPFIVAAIAGVASAASAAGVALAGVIGITLAPGLVAGLVGAPAVLGAVGASAAKIAEPVVALVRDVEAQLRSEGKQTKTSDQDKSEAKRLEIAERMFGLFEALLFRDELTDPLRRARAEALFYAALSVAPAATTEAAKVKIDMAAPDAPTRIREAAVAMASGMASVGWAQASAVFLAHVEAMVQRRWQYAHVAVKAAPAVIKSSDAAHAFTLGPMGGWSMPTVDDASAREIERRVEQGGGLMFDLTAVGGSGYGRADGRGVVAPVAPAPAYAATAREEFASRVTAPAAFLVGERYGLLFEVAGQSGSLPLTAFTTAVLDSGVRDIDLAMAPPAWATQLTTPRPAGAWVYLALTVGTDGTARALRELATLPDPWLNGTDGRTRFLLREVVALPAATGAGMSTGTMLAGGAVAAAAAWWFFGRRG